MFQFLIGRLKSSRPHLRRRGILAVSIPHRQAKIFDKDSANRKDFDMFQFLIGRLKSSVGVHYSAVQHVFQYLIGRLKSLWPTLPAFFPSRVSIPHRQAKIQVLVLPSVYFVEVSIPHRQAKILDEEVVYESTVQVSIPHRQAKIRKQMLLFQLCLIGVSIPHRQAKIRKKRQ